MSDVRAVLTEALDGHWSIQVKVEVHENVHVARHICNCGQSYRSLHEHLADVLLALPGVAVTKLPEPTATDDEGQVFFGDYDIRVDTTGTPVYRTVTTDFCQGSEFKMSFSPMRARWWGEHLLAAAVLSEGETR